MPNLRAHVAESIVEEKRFVQAGFRNQRSIRERISPAVRNAVNTIGVFHKQPRFKPLPGSWDAVREFQFEMLDPDGAGREGPITGAAEADGEIGIRNGKPTGLDGVIRPERHIDVVGNDAVGDRQRAEIGEDASVGQGGRNRRSIGGGIVDDAFDLGISPLSNRAIEDIAIGGVHAERADDCVNIRQDAGILSDIGAAGAQRPNFAAAVIAVNIRAIKLRNPKAGADHSANDAQPPVGMAVFDDGRGPDEGRRNISGVGPLHRAFVIIPAAIRSFSHDIDPLDRILPRVAEIHRAGRRIETNRHGLRIPTAQNSVRTVRRVDAEAVEIRRADKRVVDGIE